MPDTGGSAVAKRSGVLEFAVLGLLGEAPMHGYELRKRLNLMLGWGRVLSYGSLYPALKKMLRKELHVRFFGFGNPFFQTLFFGFGHIIRIFS